MSTITATHSVNDPFSRVDSLLHRVRDLAERKRSTTSPADQLAGVPVRPAVDDADQAYGEVLRLLGDGPADAHGGLDPARVARLLEL
jgi:hypothetical protein